MKGGYQGLYVKHVQQANTGADLDFLVGCRGSTVQESRGCVPLAARRVPFS